MLDTAGARTTDEQSAEAPGERLRQQIIDDEHLRLLTIFFYVSAGTTAALASFFIFHFVLLVIVATHPGVFQGPNNDNLPEQVAYVLAMVVGILILAGWTFAGLTAAAGKAIKKRRNRTFVLIMAALNSLFIPYGTILCICTFIVLARRTVKAQFGA
jgi:hypothetical protein